MDLPEIKYSLRRNRAAGNVITVHTHETWELVSYITGSGRVETDHKIYNYTPNSIVLLAPKTRHSEYNDTESDLVFIDFNPGSVNCKEGIYNTNNILSEIAIKVMSEYASRNPADQLTASLYLEILLLKLTGFQGEGYETQVENNPSLESACSYICDYYNTDIKLEEIAASVGYSPDRFRHLFKERFGITPKQLMIFNRFKAAKQMLAEDEKIENIASMCGFGSASQFILMFKKAQKMTPGKYREMIIAEKKQALKK